MVAHSNTRSRAVRIRFNTALNLAGQGFPMVLGVVLIPSILRGLGAERFGLLTLAWTLIGVSTLFDFGFGRAVTHAVSRALADGRDGDVADVATTGIFSTTLFGVIPAVILWVTAPHLMARFHVGPTLTQQALSALRIVALAIPLVTAMSGARAFLESLAAWKFINAYRVVVGLANFVGPFFLLRYTTNVAVIISFLVATRLLSLAHHIYWVHHVWPRFRITARWNPRIFSTLLRYGGWMTVSNVISPSMVYVDRFLIGGWVGLQAVTYYATPVDVLTRLLIVPNSLVAVLFPVVTEQLHTRTETRASFRSSLLLMAALVLPLMLSLIVFAHPLLRFWMGELFADKSSAVFQIIAIGVAVNAFSALPFAYIQALGRPDVTAKLHLFELPIYLGLLLPFVKTWGLVGAAAAWTLRLVIDAILLFAAWTRLSPSTNHG